jgi:hypothetical protein
MFLCENNRKKKSETLHPSEKFRALAEGVGACPASTALRVRAIGGAHAAHTHSAQT